GGALREPSSGAADETDRSVIAVGSEAKAMLGKTPPHIRVVQPLKEGVIADFEITERMLSYLIAKTQRWLRTVLKPRVVIGVPSGITQVEQRAGREPERRRRWRDHRGRGDLAGRSHLLYVGQGGRQRDG